MSDTRRIDSLYTSDFKEVCQGPEQCSPDGQLEILFAATNGGEIREFAVELESILCLIITQVLK
jgi:hypothetical protein